MALSLDPTLEELRTAVIQRIGVASRGTLPRGINGIVEEKLRSAQAMLYETAPWTARFVKFEMDVVDGETYYDVPDDTEPGKIRFISVRRVDNGQLYPLEPGIRPTERNAFRTGYKALPLRYDFIDECIEILPAPDAALYDKLVLQYHRRPTTFVEDSERSAVDGEALKMFAEILVKEHLGDPSTRSLRTDLAGYVRSLAGKQTSGSGFQMGGRMSRLTRTPRRNRFEMQRPRMDATNWWPW